MIDLQAGCRIEGIGLSVPRAAHVFTVKAVIEWVIAATPKTSRGGMRLIWFLQTTAALTLMWFAMDGTGSPAVGVGFALAGAAVGLWLVSIEPYPWPHRLLAFFLYFVRESFRGGVDVAWRAFSRRRAISPEFIEFQTSLPPGLPSTVLVAVTSLLPGTLSVLFSEEGRLLVHVLAPRGADGLVALERQVARVFSLDVPGEKA